MSFHIVKKQNTICIISKQKSEKTGKQHERYIGSLDMKKTDLTLSEFRKVFNAVINDKRVEFCKEHGVIREKV